MDILRISVPDSLKHLLPLLDSVYYRDQRYRGEENRKLFFRNKEEVARLDNQNLIIVDSLINIYGILSMKEIGMIGHMAMTMTIQHSEVETQKKYLPFFKEALQKKKVLPSTYAMLEDRVLAKSGKMQIYGTQVMINDRDKKGELYPVISPDSIDYRRTSIGISEPISLYLKKFGIIWNVDEYKEQLPGLKLKYKVTD